MKVWDILEKKCIAVLEGHTGSVKSISPHPTNPGMFTFKCVFQVVMFQIILCTFYVRRRYFLTFCNFPEHQTDVIVSCSRDGSFALWDMRCNSSSKRSEGVRIW